MGTGLGSTTQENQMRSALLVAAGIAMAMSGQVLASQTAAGTSNMPATDTPSTGPSSQTTAQNSGVSSDLFYAGVGVPSVVAIILLAVLVKARGRPQPSPPAA